VEAVVGKTVVNALGNVQSKTYVTYNWSKHVPHRVNCAQTVKVNDLNRQTR
jgi:hypothetical protein